MARGRRDTGKVIMKRMMSGEKLLVSANLGKSTKKSQSMLRARKVQGESVTVSPHFNGKAALTKSQKQRLYLPDQAHTNPGIAKTDQTPKLFATEKEFWTQLRMLNKFEADGRGAKH